MFNVGDRVRIKKGNRYSKDFQHQHEGREGIIEKITHSEHFNHHVKWDGDKYTYDYPPEMLELVEGSEGKLQKGQRVRPNPDHPHYNEYKNQHKDNFGTYNGGGYVKWDYGYENCYEDAMLIPVDENGMDIKDPYDEILATPLFIGQRVILNPEGQNYNTYKTQAKDKAGYIVSEINEESLKEWKRRTTTSKKGINVHVQWDDGGRYTYRLRDLLPVDAPILDIVKYSFDGGSSRYFHPEIPSLQKEVEELIFKHGWTIWQTKYFDEAWRQKMLSYCK